MKIFEGEFLNNLILNENSAEEARIRGIRSLLLVNDRPKISTHRARLFTEAYIRNQSDPPPIRKAKAFLHVAGNIPIPLVENQLLIGSPVSFYGAMEVYPEYHTDFLLSKVPGKDITELRYLPERPSMPVDISSRDIEALEKEILPLWRGITLSSYVRNDLNSSCPEAALFMNNAQVFMTNFGKGFSHTIQDYKSVLTRGLDTMRKEISARDDKEDLERKHYYEAMRICIDAVVEYARRCAVLCEKAARSAGPRRRAELTKMSEICRRVPVHPAGSWWEALQSICFMHAFTFISEGGVSHSFGRMDHYLYPFYKKWVEEGPESREKAQEVLECFFLKCYEYQSLRDEKSARGLSGDRTNDKITLGGIDREGRDTTNELSYRFLEAHAHVHLKEPNLSARLHRNTPNEFLSSALEVVRLGGGLPQFINDEVIIPALINKAGVDPLDARDYADVGCQENYVDPNSNPKNADTNGHSNAGFFNLVKVLELTLHMGRNPVNGTQVGPRTKDPASRATMDEFISIFKEQLSHAIKMNVLMNYSVLRHFSETISNPYHSLMHPGPREKGVDYASSGCRYNWTGAVGVGLATVSDSLMVIEELIYNKRLSTWSEMLAALKANWKGHEALRSLSLSLPRYGASGKRSEYWSKWIVDIFSEEYGRYPASKSAKDSRFVVGFFSMGIYLVLGEDVLATPDGRFANEMLSGSIAPSRYAEALGYTATHNAASGIDSRKAPNGIVFNQVMPFDMVAEPRYLNKWRDLLKTYFELGGMSVQYSIVDGNELKNAQIDPEKYRDLIVRVGGYSARFIDLSREIQDDFIQKAVC